MRVFPNSLQKPPEHSFNYKQLLQGSQLSVMIFMGHYDKKCSPFFSTHQIKSRDIFRSHFRDGQRNKATGQSASPASCRLMYDEKRDKKKN